MFVLYSLSVSLAWQCGAVLPIHTLNYWKLSGLLVFLAGSVLDCNLAPRWSVAVLCMLFNIKSNPMHPLNGELPLPMCWNMLLVVLWLFIGTQLCLHAVDLLSTTGHLCLWYWAAQFLSQKKKKNPFYSELYALQCICRGIDLIYISLLLISYYIVFMQCHMHFREQVTTYSYVFQYFTWCMDSSLWSAAHVGVSSAPFHSWPGLYSDCWISNRHYHWCFRH